MTPPTTVAPRPGGTARRGGAGGVGDHVSELWELVLAYLKQETLVPIQGLGRFIAFGAAGSVCLAIGLVLLVLAGLRALQTETGTVFAGNLSWIPYLITIVAAGVVAAMAATAIGRGSGRKETP